MASTGTIAGHTVPRIGFGAMQLPGRGVFGPPRDHDEAVAVLRRAVEAGVRHIDTAGFYGPDVSNQLIHEALHPYPEDLVIVSKVGARRDDKGAWLYAGDPDDLRAAVESDLATLGVEQVDVVNLRVHPADEADVTPFEEALGVMVELRDAGKIGSVGISAVSAEQYATAVAATDIACVQNAYSVANRGDDALVASCAGDGVAYVPFFPLGSAFAGDNSLLKDPTVASVASRLGCSPSQVCLAWLLQHSPAILLIPGTSSLSHLEDNLAADRVRLDDEALATLETLAETGIGMPSGH